MKYSVKNSNQIYRKENDTICQGTYRVSLVQLFEKMHNEKVEFQKAECLVKAVKKCIMKKLSVWLALIKVAFWGVNDQKGQYIREFISNFFFFLVDVSLFHTY